MNPSHNRAIALANQRGSVFGAALRICDLLDGRVERLVEAATTWCSTHLGLRDLLNDDACVECLV